MKRLIIIGAGAAGLFAAVEASKMGYEILILEKNDRAGKKLLATGNGRCNYTNENIDIKRYHGENPKFAFSAIKRFGYEEAVEYFENLGIMTKILSKGRAYPRSLQSRSILDVLLIAIRDKAKIVFNAEIIEIKKERDIFKVKSSDGKIYESEKLIIATGGNSYKNTGSDGSGYYLAKALGHEIVEIGPGIVQIRLKGKEFKKLSGVRFDAALYLYEGRKEIHRDLDEILFTDYGISGPAVLQLSRRAIDIINRGKSALFSIDLFPEFSNDELAIIFSTKFALAYDLSILEALIGCINYKLISSSLSGIDLDKKATDLNYEEINLLCNRLKNWKFEIEGYKDLDSAQVTTGGISTEHINPKNMESKIIEDLYFAGEIIDIDGDCGGFNLHWAWASAYSAVNGLR
ncbi:MAG: NAD(P)/FAD-dependent oxidoreductase [Tissierellia bacterium]|nr:NAD(P)/FAD-dependent oxidoreductase [Tissierellia bacterium]